MNFLDGLVKGLGPLAVGHPVDGGQEFQAIGRLEPLDQRLTWPKRSRVLG